MKNHDISTTVLTTPNEECEKPCLIGKHIEGNLGVEYEVVATTLKGDKANKFYITKRH